MRMHPFSHDQGGQMASAALPLLFATLGMTLLGVGAILSIMPLAFAGIGLAVVGFATYLISVGVDRQDRARRAKREKAQEARAAFQADIAANRQTPRSPLADHAVAALSGEGGAGIWPPIGLQESDREDDGLLRPIAARPAPTAAQAKGMWAPGSRIAPEGWEEEEVVEFTPVARSAPRQAITSGGVTFVDGSLDPEKDDIPRARPRVQPALTDPSGKAHDFRVWPGAKDLDSWTTFTGERRPQASRNSEEDIKKAMDERRRQMAGRLPTVGAILSDVGMRESELERLRREATRGKCSQCEAIIWAPKKRPIVLKCPGCGHKAKLY